jgi:MerR family transcriptional regulator, light-induced transcriptional regulator
MDMDGEMKTLGAQGLLSFQALQADAVDAVTARFYSTHGSVYEQYGPRGRAACREDLGFHLEFLRPVLEFGMLSPMVDYLCWLGSVLEARAVPVKHVALSLEWLAKFFADHMDAQEAAVVTFALQAARAGFLNSADAPLAPLNAPAPWPEATAFEASLLAGNQIEALAIMDRCKDNGQSLVDVEFHVVRSALYSIGRKWQANQVTVAREHMATAIAQSVMTLGLLQSPLPALNGKRALLACVEGNHHAVGLRMVADAFQLAGWDVQYLGSNVPTSALVLQTLEWKPDLVGLSVSFAQQLRVVRDIMEKLKERMGGARPAVIIGGLATNRFDRLASLVGADAYGADAQAAVVRAKQLVGV